MAEGITATFGFGDEVTVLQKEDRDGGGHGVVTTVIGTSYLGPHSWAYGGSSNP